MRMISCRGQISTAVQFSLRISLLCIVAVVTIVFPASAADTELAQQEWERCGNKGQSIYSDSESGRLTHNRWIAALPKPESHGSTDQVTDLTSSVPYSDLALFGDVFERIRSNYFQKLNDSELIEGAINGMIAKLDSHSSYLDAKSVTAEQMPGGDIGFEFKVETGLIKVWTILQNGPAANAGMQAGDVIIGVDDVPMKGLGRHDVNQKLRGPVNTQVKVTVARLGSEKPIELVIRRERRRPSVSTRIEGTDVGYIRIERFDELATQGIEKAIADISARLSANELRGYVLDLRNNAGGLIDQAISVADAFLDKGEIVSTRGRRSDENRRFAASPGDLTQGKPVIVLVNGGTAAGAEIVAGAMQDHKRARLVGTRTFGEGSIQTIIPLGKERGVLRLTTSVWVTPSGRSIEGTGIVPDFEVLQEGPESTKSISRSKGEAATPEHLISEGRQELSSQCYIPPDPKSDKALSMAVDLLHGAAH